MIGIHILGQTPGEPFAYECKCTQVSHGAALYTLCEASWEVHQMGLVMKRRAPDPLSHLWKTVWRKLGGGWQSRCYPLLVKWGCRRDPGKASDELSSQLQPPPQLAAAQPHKLLPLKKQKKQFKTNFCHHNCVRHIFCHVMKKR